MIKKLLSLKRIQKNCKHSIRAILEVKIILMKMVHQIYLVFQPTFRYCKISTINNNTNYVLPWKSKGLSDETIKPLQHLIIVLHQH